ncbi:hypothetical protein ACFSTE_12175, partial [Aquimarina hainanensis]
HSELYKEKEKRFKPSDNLYSSGDNGGDIYNDLANFTNYEYYIATGVCPKARDLEMYLNYYFKEYSSGIPASSTYRGGYLTPALFTDLGGSHPTDAAVEIRTNLTASNKTLDIRFYQNNQAVGTIPISVSLPASFSNTWQNYGAGTWQITSVKQIYSSYDASSERFRYQVLAEVTIGGTTTQEIVLSGQTQARIAACSITEADGVGEYIGDGSGTDISGCNNTTRFETALRDVMYELEQRGTLNNGSVSLNSMSSYSGSYLATFFGAGAALWKADGRGTYELTVGGVTRLTMELGQVLDPAVIEVITGANVNYLYNDRGQITQQQLNITYREADHFPKVATARLYESCDVVTGVCRLINLLCCGDINDLVGEDNQVTCEKQLSCQQNGVTEAFFENSLLQMINQGVSRYPVGQTYQLMNTPLVASFKNDFELQTRFQHQINILYENVLGNSFSRIKIPQTEMRYYAEENSSGTITKNKIEFKFSEGGDSNYAIIGIDLKNVDEYGNSYWYPYDANETVIRVSEIQEVLCVDIQEVITGGISFNGKKEYWNSGSLCSATELPSLPLNGGYKVKVTFKDKSGVTHSRYGMMKLDFKTIEVETWLYDPCSFFEDITPCSYAHVGTDEFDRLFGHVVEDILLANRSNIISQNTVSIENVDITTLASFQNLMVQYPVKEYLEYSIFTANGAPVIDKFDYTNATYTITKTAGSSVNFTIKLNEYYQLSISFVWDFNMNSSSYYRFKTIVPVIDPDGYRKNAQILYEYEYNGNIYESYQECDITFLSAVNFDLPISDTNKKEVDNCVFFNVEELQGATSGGVILASGNTIQLARSTTIPDETIPCGPTVCIPPVVEPLSCTTTYSAYTGVMSRIGDTEAEDIVSAEDFCQYSLQYLVADYEYYLTKLGIVSTLDLYYLTISEFGATAFNYGYPGMRRTYKGRPAVIDLYQAHVSSSGDSAKSWTAFTTDYLNTSGNEDICVPRPFFTDFTEVTVTIPD